MSQIHLKDQLKSRTQTPNSDGALPVFGKVSMMKQKPHNKNKEEFGRITYDKMELKSSRNKFWRLEEPY